MGLWKARKKELLEEELQKVRIPESQNYRKTNQGKMELQKQGSRENRITERRNYENKDLHTNLITKRQN